MNGSGRRDHVQLDGYQPQVLDRVSGADGVITDGGEGLAALSQAQATPVKTRAQFRERQGRALVLCYRPEL